MARRGLSIGALSPASAEIAGGNPFPIRVATGPRSEQVQIDPNRSYQFYSFLRQPLHHGDHRRVPEGRPRAARADHCAAHCACGENRGAQALRGLDRAVGKVDEPAYPGPSSTEDHQDRLLLQGWVVQEGDRRIQQGTQEAGS